MAINSVRAKENKEGNVTRRPSLAAVIEALDPRMLLSSVPLHVAGTHLVDPAGNTVRLRGVDIDSLEYLIKGDHVLQSVGVALNQWHATLIRLPMNENFWFGYNHSSSPGDNGAAYRALVDQIVSTVSQNNAYVVLDLHWSDEDVWGANDGQHLMPDDHSTLFWQQVASKYANNASVFFDLYNEPHDIAWTTWRDGGTLTENSISYHSPGMQGLLNTVRAAGANNIVMASGNDWAADFTGLLTGSALNDPAGNLMYQAHLYPYNKTGQTPAAWDAKVSAVAARYALYVGEFGTDNQGTTNSDGTPDPFIGANPDAAGWTQTMLSWLDQHQYSWTAWSFNPQTRPVLLSDWNYTPTTYYGQYVKNSLAQPVAGPRVDGVAVSGTGWAITPYSIPSGPRQIADLPWTNLQQIRITFSENVSIAQSDLTLSGAQGSSYGFTDFSYDAATFTAVWTLASPLGADHIQLSLAGVRDTTWGYALDGEWTDAASSFPSGDGTTGGNFVFHFNVLPGDIDGDGKVDFNDLVLLARSFASASPLVAADLNGDAQVNFADLVLLARNYGRAAVLTATLAPRN